MPYELLDDEAPSKGYQLLPEEKKGTGSTALDTGNAVGTGYWNAASRLIGVPVDTIANVRDLLKAGAGSAYIAATGKPAPEFLEIGDRSKDVGSGDNIIKNVRKTSAGRVMLDPVNPDYTGGYAQAAGAGLTGIASPRTVLQGLNQAVNSVGGTALGKYVYDNTGSVPLSIMAGMSPTAMQSAATEGTKLAIRGGEDGRKVMAQRIQDLKNAGVENPTMGLASGNNFIGGVENILSNTPGAVGTMGRARQSAIDGLEAKINGAANLASTNRGSMESGQSIQSGVRSFRDDVKARQASLYDKLDKFIPAQTPVNVANTKTTLGLLNADIPGAPELSKQFKNSRIAAIEDAMRSDTKGTPPSVMLNIKGGGGLWNSPVVTQQIGLPAGSSPNLLPFEAVKKTRTLVGNEIADTNIASAVPRSKWNPLYGALSSDLQGAANAAGPDAARTFNRANDYTRASIGRLDRIAPIVERPAPEQTFGALSNTLKDNASTFQAVKKSLPEGARGDFAGTVIERLGRAAAGAQDDTGSRFSTETFLTNWNKMGDKAKAELLSGFPNSSQVRADVEAVAKATSMMRDNSKIWANPSGTAANMAARGYLGALGLGGASMFTAAGVDPLLLGSAAALPLAAKAGAWALTSPKVVKSVASKSYIDPQMLNAQVNSLMGSGLLGYPYEQ